MPQGVGVQVPPSALNWSLVFKLVHACLPEDMAGGITLDKIKVKLCIYYSKKQKKKGEEEMKRYLFIILSSLIIASFILSGCANTAPTKVRVATDATWPPFESVDETTKEIVGLDIDLMKAVAQKGGFEVEFINVSWDPLLAGMAQCQYDAAISSITITDDRKQKMGFSNPYFEAGQIVTVQASNTDITGKESLSGKKIGAQLGTTGAIEAGKIAGAVVKTYDDIGLAFQDLLNSQIDAVIADNPLALGYVVKNAGKLKTAGAAFTDEFYGIAVCSTNKDLLDKINKGLAAVKSEGLIDKLAKQWMSSTK